MKFKDMPYERVKFEEVERKFAKLMKSFQEANSGEDQFEIHKEYYRVMDDIETLIIIANIRHDVDTTDEFYKAEKEFYDEMEPKLSNLVVVYQKALYESKYRAYLEEKIGKVAFKNIEISLKSFDEKLIPLMQAENALVTKYNSLIANAKIEWEGDTLNLALLRPYLAHDDREVRAKAYEKYTAYFDSNSEELDEIFTALVQNRTTQAKELGYDNYIELGYYRMNRNCYGKEQVENFRSQIKKEFVSFADKMHERRRVRLGLDKLSFIDEDIMFLQGNPKPQGSPEEIMENGQKMYQELSPETKEFFDFMMKNEMFDVLGRKTKKAGGYMTYLPNYKSPYIFANFNGTSGDIDVITHECGHAFQGYLSGFDNIKEHSDITMETAEIHSMAMEYFTEPWMKLFFGDRAKDYISMHLEESIAFIPYGCMVDEFQHIIYENPEMTAVERHTAWSKLEKQYKPHLDYGDNHFFGKGGFWQKQLHIYNYPFYYIDYVLAQICAIQFKVKMDENYQEAWDSYLKLCKLSASDFYTNMIKEVGLFIPFEDGSVKAIVERLEIMIDEEI